MTDDDLISSHEAAELLGVDPSTVWRMTRDGRLTIAQSVGGDIRPAVNLYHRADIEQYIANRPNVLDADVVNLITRDRKTNP